LLPKPMLAKKMTRIPVRDGWWMEPKFDGWRVLCGLDDGVVMWTRSLAHVTQVPYIAEAIAAHFPRGTILDGEIVDLRSARQWNRTQSILSSTRAGFTHRPSEGDPPLTYILFDLLCIGGRDIRQLPLSERRAELERQCDGPAQAIDGVVELIPTAPPSDAGLDTLIKYGFEGVVVKRTESRYLCGSRNGGWGKIKPSAEIEAVCTGIYPAEPGSHYAPIVSGKPRPWAVGGIRFRLDHGDGRVYDGRAAGMNDAVRSQLHETPEKFVGLIVELTHWGVNDTGALRHPQVKRFRSPADKTPGS
jgi:ATP-dependent DNA ligase